MSGGGATGATNPTDVQVYQDAISGIEGFLGALNGNTVQVVGGVREMLPLITDALTILAPGASIGGLAATKIVGIAAGLLDGAPDLVNAYDAVKAAVNGGAAPTPEQWSAFNAAADAAHNDLQAAITAYKASAAGGAAAGGPAGAGGGAAGGGDGGG